jgi:phospholipid/cholesterol/gamma-HCH transport system permease protein
MQILTFLGEYAMFLKSLLRRPQKWREFIKESFVQMQSIGLGSFGIVSLISFFVGAVSTIQIGYQLLSGLIPDYVLGRVVRDSNILEFSPTITCLVLAGKVGSNIASEIGTMKVTEQIDAMEVMGLNSRNFIVLPKIIGGLVTIPTLVIYAMFLSLVGGAISGYVSGMIGIEPYVRGLRADFIPFSVAFAMIKSTTYAFIITSVSAYCGYRTEGGALEVGQSSTKAVVYSCVGIILFDYILTDMLLSKTTAI